MHTSLSRRAAIISAQSLQGPCTPTPWPPSIKRQRHVSSLTGQCRIEYNERKAQTTWRSCAARLSALVLGRALMTDMRSKLGGWRRAQLERPYRSQTLFTHFSPVTESARDRSAQPPPKMAASLCTFAVSLDGVRSSYD